MSFGLKMPIHATFRELGGGGKMEGKRKLLRFYPSRNEISADWRPMNQNA